MEGFVGRGEIAGSVTLVARHGRIAHLECRGYQDAERSRAMATDTIFRVYSMSKPITAVAVLMLYEERHFLLDDPIARYIPELGRMKVYAGETADGMVLVEQERPITIRHLLTHTSGLAYGIERTDAIESMYADADAMKLDESLAEKIDRLADLPLAHQPGTCWRYGLGIDVLGRLIELISGRDLDEFLRARLFEPLGMTDSGFHVPPASADRLAEICAPTSAGRVARVEAPFFEYARKPRFLSGGGGLVATATDYARFAQMLVNGGEFDGVRILGRKTVDLLAAPVDRTQVPVVPADWPFSAGYAMALGVQTLVDVGASGALGSVGAFTWQGMASTDFWVDPAEDLVGVTMVQVLPQDFRPARVMRVLTYAALTD